MTKTPGIDVIGDVHGCHRELASLLKLMGYRQRGGIWQHPRRRVVFVGDLIDRGPEIGPVLETVAAMVEAGAATCLLGNHERDAVFYHTRRRNGKFIRARDEIREEQLEVTHAQLGKDSEAMRGWIRWMRDLPVVFEVPGLRVVHSAWRAEAVDFWRNRTLADESLWEALADRQSDPSRTLSDLVFGPVIWGRRHGKEVGIRARWYVAAARLRGKTFRHAAYRRSVDVPPLPLRPQDRLQLWGYAGTETPLIFGHQQVSARSTLRPIRKNLACVDFSAVYGGKLCAYRWAGETVLSERNFVSVPFVARD